MRAGGNKISGAGRNMAPYRALRSISALLQKSMAPKRELTAEMQLKKRRVLKARHPMYIWN